MTPPNLLTEWAALLMQSLAAAGVREVVTVSYTHLTLPTN